MVKTAVLVSGGGTNLQAILDALADGKIKNCEICAVISSSSDAYALTRAEKAGVPSKVVDVKKYPDRQDYTDAVERACKEAGAELVVLAGFLYVLSPSFSETYENRVINIHPALIPSFCGNGAYGLRVHKKALAYGVKVSGATSHFVVAEADAGPIILQKAVQVEEDDTPETLQHRIMEQAEWKILPESISLFCQGRLAVEGRRVRILPEVNEQ